LNSIGLDRSITFNPEFLLCDDAMRRVSNLIVDRYSGAAVNHTQTPLSREFPRLDLL
jgi:hypothetical protein